MAKIVDLPGTAAKLWAVRQCGSVWNMLANPVVFFILQLLGTLEEGIRQDVPGGLLLSPPFRAVFSVYLIRFWVLPPATLIPEFHALLPHATGNAVRAMPHRTTRAGNFSSAFSEQCGSVWSMVANPVVFFTLQVSEYIPCNRSDDLTLLLLPSPLNASLSDHMNVIVDSCMKLLLILSGDIEGNPGPLTDKWIADALDAPTLLKTIAVQQNDVLQKLDEVKEQQKCTDEAVNETRGRLASIEQEWVHLEDVKNEVRTLGKNTQAVSESVKVLDERLDDLENRQKRNNLIFHPY